MSQATIDSNVLRHGIELALPYQAAYFLTRISSFKYIDFKGRMYNQ